MKNRSILGYNLIAPFYDDLAGLVFGQPLFDAQTFYFSEIPDGGKVLILGGGSGWILPFLFRQKPNVHVSYVDASERMIELAKTRNYPVAQVQFILGTEASIPVNFQFDAIILNFYVDGFSFNQLPSRLQLINVHMKTNAVWLVTDFAHTGKPSHRFILWLTHVFFRILIKHPNKRLVEWWKVFEQSRLKLTKEKSWSDGLIKSVLYKSVD